MLWGCLGFARGLMWVFQLRDPARPLAHSGIISLRHASEWTFRVLQPSAFELSSWGPRHHAWCGDKFFLWCSVRIPDPPNSEDVTNDYCHFKLLNFRLILLTEIRTSNPSFPTDLRHHCHILNFQTGMSLFMNAFNISLICLVVFIEESFFLY